jgi:hypothetical protein
LEFPEWKQTNREIRQIREREFRLEIDRVFRVVRGSIGDVRKIPTGFGARVSDPQAWGTLNTASLCEVIGTTLQTFPDQTLSIALQTRSRRTYPA